MDRLEFSYQFDLLYNNISSNQAPGLNEYEKSVFLTKAQDEILKSYFDPRLNKPMEGFDGSERRQIDFSNILYTDKFQVVTSKDDNDTTGLESIEKKGYFAVKIPNNALMVINEFLTVDRSGRETVLSVTPITYAEWNVFMTKPYKRPPHTQAWRLLTINKYATIIAGPNDYIPTNNTAYTVRYIKNPYPIILDWLTEEGVTINGHDCPVGRDIDVNPTSKMRFPEDTCCELDPILHEEILQRAVELAKAAYQGDLSTMVQLGQTSHTPIGVVQQQQSQRQQ